MWKPGTPPLHTTSRGLGAATGNTGGEGSTAAEAMCGELARLAPAMRSPPIIELMMLQLQHAQLEPSYRRTLAQL